MRIALFTETYLPHINGVVTHVKILRDGLLQQGHEVLVVTADYQTRHHYIKDGILHCPAIKSKRFYGYGVASPFSRRRLKLVQDFHPDIIHIHNEFGIGLSGIFAAKQLHVPLVYTLHTMYDDYLYYVAPRHLLRAAKKVSHDYFRLLGNAATELTGPSPKCQEYFQQIGVKKDVNVIPNAVELDDFSPDRISAENKAAFRRRYQIPDDVMIACFVGRLGHEKSVDVLLDYWARTITPEDKIMLCIIGGGPVQEELEQQAKRLGHGKLAAELGVGVPTLEDMIEELLRPGRDMRDSLPKPLLRTDVLDMKDLTPGMQLTGTVRNVIDFGAFVDIGVHQDGLVHISQISSRFIRHPSEVLKVGDVVTVWVLSVDLQKKRIALTMKQPKTEQAH